ncbi:FecCD family ABC transporter permease [Crossiella cryophila]|uniref:Iron complex transport system permease protein n=1 Tax=Crossiella cryophila TaxID=43355 RepID=A0A7W7FUD3_9PSEU|nr:iron chelate uptake ABC transporter family permease subunit [Crossiella cryophila]MBB4677333.1 iron complex transport system permease protein [Crossiella cryophila]
MTDLATRPRPSRVLRSRGGHFSLRLHGRTAAVVLGLVLAILVIGAFTLTIGEYELTVGQVLAALAGEGGRAAQYVITEFRLPRWLTGLLVGAALAVSGALMQSLARNPLGSPDFIGFTTGAATGGILMIITGASAAQLAFGAIAGGLLTALAMYLLAFTRGVHGSRLVLVGVGVNAILIAVNSYLISRAELRDATIAQAWLTGSLNARGWEHVLPVGIALALLLPLAFTMARRLALLEMGDEAASALGVPVQRSRAVLMVTSVALAAVAVASAGPVAFVALMAPQLARRLTRAASPVLVPTALMGAFVVSLSDFAAQRLFSPIAVPVGVMTAAVGGIYLAWLLATEWRGR